MQNYFETKDQYPGCILFYRLGDFYEMFFDDAITASKALEITLTGKECGLEERAPMCGVPFHAADNYIDRLVKKGYRVAIAEQMEDPKLAKGLVKREVIRVVTPGTICDNKALDETKNNYLMSIAYVGGIYGVSTCDVSTGEFYLTEDEEKLIEAVSGTFAHKVLLINPGYPIDVRCIEKYGIDAAVWTGLSGMNGGRAVAEILSGQINPSGKLPNVFFLYQTALYDLCKTRDRCQWCLEFM